MSLNEKKISVVIPVFNVEKYLEQCIDSVLNQTYSNYEILLINDCSTDNSLAICQKYERMDNRIKVINKAKNEGLSAARNTGVEMATGEYIYFLDSDDYIHKNLFKYVIGYMENNNLDLCYFSGEVYLDGDGLTWNENAYIKNYKYNPDSGAETLKKLYYNKEYTCQNCMFVTKLSLIRENKIKYHEGIIYEDNHFAFLLALAARKASVLNDIFYVRRVRPGSIMTSTDKIKLKIYSNKMVADDFYSMKINKDREIKMIVIGYIRNFTVSAIRETLKLKSKEENKRLWNYFISKKFFYDYKIFGYSVLKLILKGNTNE